MISLHVFTSTILNLPETRWISKAPFVILFKTMIKTNKKINPNPPPNTKRAMSTPHSMQVLTYQQLSTWQDSWASHSWRVLAKGCSETLSHAGPLEPVWWAEFTSQFSGEKQRHFLHPQPHTLLLISLMMPSNDVSFAPRHDPNKNNPRLAPKSEKYQTRGMNSKQTDSTTFNCVEQSQSWVLTEEKFLGWSVPFIWLGAFLQWSMPLIWLSAPSMALAWEVTREPWDTAQQIHRRLPCHG